MLVWPLSWSAEDRIDRASESEDRAEPGTRGRRGKRGWLAHDRQSRARGLRRRTPKQETADGERERERGTVGVGPALAPSSSSPLPLVAQPASQCLSPLKVMFAALRSARAAARPLARQRELLPSPPQPDHHQQSISYSTPPRSGRLACARSSNLYPALCQSRALQDEVRRERAASPSSSTDGQTRPRQPLWTGLVSRRSHAVTATPCASARAPRPVR